MRALPPLLLLLSLLLPACASKSPPGSPAPSSSDDVPVGGGTVSIENHRSSDMDIYVLRRGTAVRLGFAPGGQTTRFTLAPGLIAGAGIVQFLAKPTRGGESVTSDSFTFQPGAELHWTVPS